MDNILRNAEQLLHQGRLADAHKAITQALEREPNNLQAIYLMGETLLLLNHLDEALDYLLKAVSSEQAQPCWHIMCGAALEKKGLFKEAENSYQLGEMLGCTDVRMYYLLGNFYSNILPDYEKSELYYAQLIRNHPDQYFAYIALSGLYLNQMRCEEAIQALDHCLTNGYETALLYINLAKALSHQGRQEDALTCNRKAIELDPNNLMARRNCIVQLLYTVDDQAKLYREIKKLTTVFNIGAAARFSGPVDCTPGRKLRLGFISADLRKHAINHYFLPIYRQLDKELFSIHIYYNHHINDQFTNEYKSRADSWCYSKELTDEQLANKIRSDKIDIIVDLSNHTAGNRLTALRTRPAPMQAFLMGVPVTTGLTYIDYAIRSRLLVKICNLENNLTEKILPVDNLAYYDPLRDLPPLTEPPCIQNGYITFGSFNGLRKIDLKIFDVWAKLLLKVANSKLRIVIEDDKNTLMRDHILDLFASFGVEKSRILLQPRQDIEKYFASHNLVDIALDPYPYHGETTTYNSLLMGLPIVSRTGETEASNAATRILSALNRQEWLAKDFDEYIQIATALAENPEHLIELRKKLRGEIENSSIMDYEGITRRIETALLSGWKDTCRRYNQQQD